MADFIEYELEDGSIIQIAGVSKRGTRGAGFVGETSAEADKPPVKFLAALENAKKSAQAVVTQFTDLQADEVEVAFSLTTTGEAGNFAIGRVGVEANYTVKLKWTNKDE